MVEVGGFSVMAIQFISLRGNAIKTKHSFTNTVHSWQVVALPLKSQLGGSFSMALGDIIHVLGRPRCGLCCVKKNVLFTSYECMGKNFFIIPVVIPAWWFLLHMNCWELFCIWFVRALLIWMNSPAYMVNDSTAYAVMELFRLFQQNYSALPLCPSFS